MMKALMIRSGLLFFCLEDVFISLSILEIREIEGFRGSRTEIIVRVLSEAVEPGAERETWG